uniref:Ubiquitin-like domain-containing protein n=1 Tax=Glossina pallidipes TaxID=7398 RepID=A0A1B0A4H1_GLOPL
MDDTNTTATSTAAAVADGATTKILDTPSKTNSITTPKTTSSTSVKLLIKASNQQYDDMTVDCDLLWTVKNLKAHLSWVYPSKPPVTDQKLIYSGQLLNDKLMLKDVIRNYKDVYTHNHIIHLVYSSKTSYKPVTNLKSKTQLNTSTLADGGNSNMSSSLDGLRQRQTATVTQQQPQQQQQQQQPQRQQQQPQQQQLPNITMSQTQFMPHLLTAGVRCPQMGEQYNMQAFATQQVAMYNWMQQIYSQYMEQCLRLSNMATGVSDGEAVDSANTPSAAAFTNPFLLQQYAFNMNTPPVIVPLGQIPATTNAITNDPVDAANGVAGQQRPPVAPAPELQQVQAPAVAPRFPNIAQDDQENRDWLDSLFSVIRFMLFLTILYINSSPLRCLMVFIIAAVIYCYHIGVFRIRQERNNNNLNRNNNAAVAAAVAVDQIRQGIEQQQQQQVVDAGAAGPGQGNDIQNQENIGQNTDADAGGDANRLPSQGNNAENLNANANVSDQAGSLSSALSFVRTFVVTFFTSLLPEMPAV